MWDVTCTELNVSPQPAALEARKWSPDSYSLSLRSENIIFKLRWYFLQCTVQNYSLAFPRVLCHFPELITLWEFAVYALCFLHSPISCQCKRIKRRPQVHNGRLCPGALTTQTAVISWNLMFWGQEHLEVLNNTILQTTNKGQLWKRQRQSLNVLITVFQAEMAKYWCYCVKHFCCLLWHNAYHSIHTREGHKLKDGQDDPEFGDPIT